MSEKKPSKIKKAVVKNSEHLARRGLLEELFWDFHRSRKQVYWMNFTRGIFFGVGSVIGGTLIVALVVTILNLLVDIPGGIGEGVKFIVDSVEQN